MGREGGRRHGGESSSIRLQAKALRAPWRGEAQSVPLSANLQPGLGVVQGGRGWKFKGPFWGAARKAAIGVIHCGRVKGLLQACLKILMFRNEACA